MAVSKTFSTVSKARTFSLKDCIKLFPTIKHPF
jgi:hypothetical protein